MRVCMAMTVLAPLGGIEAALVPLAHELTAQGHEVMVYAREPVKLPNQNAAALEADGVRVLASPKWLYSLAMTVFQRRARLARTAAVLAAPLILAAALMDTAFRRRPLRRALQGGFGRVHGWAAERLDLPALLDWQLRRAFRRWRPNVVHVHGWGCGHDPAGMLGWLRAGRYATVYTEHNSPNPKTDAPIDNAPLNLAEVVIAVSEAGRQGLLEVGQASRPIHVIPYSVAPLPSTTLDGHRPIEAFVITCVARLNPQKGHADLLRAMARVAAEAPHAQLQLAGVGPLRAELEAQAADLGLNGRVSFLGLVTRDRLADLLAGTDVMVLPSYWEGLPVSLIEGLSAGKPIVASDAGGNPELVRHGENGLIFAAGDVDALSAALLELARHPERLRGMGEASRQRFAGGGFSPQAVTALHLKAYQQARDEATRAERDGHGD